MEREKEFVYAIFYLDGEVWKLYRSKNGDLYASSNLPHLVGKLEYISENANIPLRRLKINKFKL